MKIFDDIYGNAVDRLNELEGIKQIYERKEPSDRVRALYERKMQKSRNETRHFYFLRFYTLLFQK